LFIFLFVEAFSWNKRGEFEGGSVSQLPQRGKVGLHSWMANPILDISFHFPPTGELCLEGRHFPSVEPGDLINPRHTKHFYRKQKL
jgi:hypothetical protein